MNSRLAERLHRMVFRDQAAIFSGHYKDPIFKHNRAALKKIIATSGFPSISLVGEQGSRDAWLIVQHCDFDIPFQKKYLGMMRMVTKRDDVLKQNLAYLEDRVRMNEGKPQIYGTQFKRENEKLLLYTLKDIKGLDAKRKKMNLPPLKEYLKSAASFNKSRQHVPPRPNELCPCNSKKKWKVCHGRKLSQLG